jgi:transcriptional regulator with XRE-family HTH domain
MKSLNRLRVVRAEKRVTQEELEARTDRLKKRVTQSRISLIENGAEADASEQRVLARALRVPVQDVFPAPEAASR